MPEIGEVARTVHYIRKHLVGRKLSKVVAVEDGSVFGKAGTSHIEIMKHLTGKTVVDAGQQGKYFWMIMSSPPHPVIHFGMAGWLKFKSEHTYYYRKKDDQEEQWPPKYWKVIFETDGSGDKKIEAAYVDQRRFGRVRLVDCPGKDIRKHSPLVENGPDPVQDKEKVTVEWLKEICRKKRVPIKAMLLDQANISGIGNWVGDEIMYDAKMHPEQYANTLSDPQIEQLHKSIHYICGTAVELLADSEQFPESWLFKHRWSKGKKDAPKTLPNGEKIVFLTVGGRTSAVIPSVQRKTGPVAKEMSEAEDEEKSSKKTTNKIGTKRAGAGEDEKESKPLAKKMKSSNSAKVEDAEEQLDVEAPATKRQSKLKFGPSTKTEDKVMDSTLDDKKTLTNRNKGQKSLADEIGSEEKQETTSSNRAKKAVTKVAESKSRLKSSGATEGEAQDGRRRSGRLKR